MLPISTLTTPVNSFLTTSVQRQDVESTSKRDYFNVVCPLGEVYNLTNSGIKICKKDSRKTLKFWNYIR